MRHFHSNLSCFGFALLALSGCLFDEPASESSASDAGTLEDTFLPEQDAGDAAVGLEADGGESTVDMDTPDLPLEPVDAAVNLPDLGGDTPDMGVEPMDAGGDTSDMDLALPDAHTAPSDAGVGTSDVGVGTPDTGVAEMCPTEGTMRCGASCVACPTGDTGVTETACSLDRCVASACASGYVLRDGACTLGHREIISFVPNIPEAHLFSFAVDGARVAAVATGNGHTVQWYWGGSPDWSYETVATTTGDDVVSEVELAFDSADIPHIIFATSAPDAMGRPTSTTRALYYATLVSSGWQVRGIYSFAADERLPYEGYYLHRHLAIACDALNHPFVLLDRYAPVGGAALPARVISIEGVESSQFDATSPVYQLGIWFNSTGSPMFMLTDTVYSLKVATLRSGTFSYVTKSSGYRYGVAATGSWQLGLQPDGALVSMQCFVDGPSPGGYESYYACQVSGWPYRFFASTGPASAGTSRGALLIDALGNVQIYAHGEIHMGMSGATFADWNWNCTFDACTRTSDIHLDGLVLDRRGGTHMLYWESGVVHYRFLH